MPEYIEWNDVYKLWSMRNGISAVVLADPVEQQIIHVPYDKDDGHCFYGYDWLPKDLVVSQTDLIQNSPTQFLYFTRPSNKGTIQTAEMLATAADAEEQAAIWIAATTFELRDFDINRELRRTARILNYAAIDFLRNRFRIWHHAMRQLVPDIMIPYSVLENISCPDYDTTVDLIKMNTVLLKNYYSVLLYTSLEDGVVPASKNGYHL